MLDLNLEFHKLKFPEYQKYFQNLEKWNNYDETAKKYQQLSSKIYSENNKKVVNGENPEFFAEIMEKITEKKPDIIAFSIVYSSQAFYAYALLKEIKEKLSKVKTIIGGPAVNEKLKMAADETLNNEVEFLEFINGGKADHDQLNLNIVPDFSGYRLNEYFTPYPVIPIRTSNTCYYQQCSFCSHFRKIPYCEFSLEDVKETIIKSKQKHFFLIDDMIPVKRLLKIAEMMKPLNVKWTCQLKPTKDFNNSVFNHPVLKELKESGLSMVIWGVESGNDRVLNLMKKGTNRKDIEKVLSASHQAGIKNVTYIMFGFPGERKEEFLETIGFLKDNSQNIDLVSVSIFGLQKGSSVHKNPEKFGVVDIIAEKRTILDEKLSYRVKEGLSGSEAEKLRNSHKKTIEKINKYPKMMNFFREHMFCLS